MRAVRAAVFKGLVDDHPARKYLGSGSVTGLRPSQGPMGEEEVRYVGVCTFPFGRIVGLFGVWPGHDRDVYAVVVDENFPEFFGLYHLALPDRLVAEGAWESLVLFEGERNERLGAALVAGGWTQLVP